MNPDPFEGVAPLYDLDYGDFIDDLNMYLNFAARTGDPILELGVGTGRLAIPLVEAGFRVTGVDTSEEMVKICQAKVASLDQGRLELVMGDIGDFKLRERFSLVISAANSFGHLLTREEQTSALRCAREHLIPGGLLILDIDNPLTRLAPERDGELVLAWTKKHPSTHNLVCKFVSSYTEKSEQIQQFTYIYDEVDRPGSVTRTVVSFPLRYSYRAEVELLLGAAGYTVEAVYGDYYLDEYVQDSDRMIFVASPK